MTTDQPEDDQKQDDRNRCDWCEAPLANRPWLGLNRFAVGTGTNRGLREIMNADGECVWEIDTDGPPEEDVASMRVLHWPDCARAYIEMVIVGCDVTMAMRGEA